MLTKEECIKSLTKLTSVKIVELIGADKENPKNIKALAEYQIYCDTLQQLIEEHFDNPPKIDGNTSDGYHTFNELYHHRAVLFSVICNQNKEIAWKSKQHNDGTMYDGMFIVGVDTPQGQYSYHYDIEPYWNMFNVKELDKAPLWDGHEPKDIDRLISLENNPPLKFEELKEEMWVWDNKIKQYYQISCVFKDNREMATYGLMNGFVLYEENRFYRKQVEE